MTTEPGTIRKVAWREVFPSAILLTALRLAGRFQVLILAGIGLLVVSVGWQLLAWVLIDADDVAFRTAAIDAGRWPWQSSLIAEPELSPSLTWTRYVVPQAQVWQQLAGPFHRLLAPLSITLRQFVYLLLGGLWSLAVWSLFGGAITRIAAVALAREESISPGQSIGFARSKWAQYFTAPLYPLVAILFAAVPLAVLGLLARIEFGVLIAGLLWPLVLLAGIFMAVLAVGLAFGWPLMWATISTEGSDSFDALSSTYAYVYQRPLCYALYVILATLLGSFGWWIAAIFRDAIIGLSIWAVGWGSGQAVANGLVTVPIPVETSFLAGFGSTLIRCWTHLVELLPAAFLSAFFWTAATAIYFLLRLQVDATEFDEVAMPKVDESYGLPPLKTDAAGVPQAADLPPEINPDPTARGE